MDRLDPDIELDESKLDEWEADTSRPDYQAFQEFLEDIYSRDEDLFDQGLRGPPELWSQWGELRKRTAFAEYLAADHRGYVPITQDRTWFARWRVLWPVVVVVVTAAVAIPVAISVRGDDSADPVSPTDAEPPTEPAEPPRESADAPVEPTEATGVTEAQLAAGTASGLLLGFDRETAKPQFQLPLQGDGKDVAASPDADFRFRVAWTAGPQTYVLEGGWTGDNPYAGTITDGEGNEIEGATSEARFNFDSNIFIEVCFDGGTESPDTAAAETEVTYGDGSTVTSSVTDSDTDDTGDE